MDKHSEKFEVVKQYYNSNLWNKQMVLNAIGCWITKEESDEILGVVNK